MNPALPKRIQDELAAADAAERAIQEAQAAAPAAVGAADLIAPLAVQPVSAPPRAPTPAAAPPAAKPDDFEQRYKTLQGMYNAEVKNLRGQLHQLTEQVTQALAAKEAAPQPTAPTVDPKDIERFGDEMMEMVQRYVTGAVDTLTERVVAVEAALSGVSQQTAQSTEKAFYTLLGQLVPDWREVNADERWLAWLSAVDSVYGVERQAALDAAFKRGDAQQVAKVFEAFKASLPPPVVRPSLEDQVVPDASASGAPSAPAAKPVLSQKAITDFYNDMARGKYRGRENEAAAIEAEINAAVMEGRVR